jgi:hypothetical protein
MLRAAGGGVPIWELLWIVCIYLLCINVGYANNHHHLVRTCTPGTNHSASLDECRYFLLLKGHTLAREIVDIDTMKALNINASAVHTVTDEVFKQSFKLGDNVPSLKITNWNPDEIIRIELLKLQTLTDEELIYEHAGIGPFVNPSVVIFRNRMLLCTALSWGAIYGLKGPANDHIELRWINHTDYPFFEDPGTVTHQYLGIPTNTSEAVAFADPFNTKEPLVGQDPRLLVIDDTTVLVAYTNRYATPLKMGLAVIKYSEILNKLVVTEVYIAVEPNEDNYAPQKNWTPFMYEDTIHFIQHFSPFTVSVVDRSVPVHIWSNNDQWFGLNSKQIHVHKDVRIPWHYGELRGGTNCVLIDDVPGHKPFYLTFFHTSKHLEGNSLLTYFMGAVAFSAQPPFTPLAVSPYPVVNEKLYTGMLDVPCSCRCFCTVQTSFCYRNVGHI